MAGPVKSPTSAQVMISWSVSLSPTSGSVLTAQSLELALYLCLPLSLPLPHSQSVFLFLSKINKHKENNNALGILSIVGVEVREGHLIALNRNNHGVPGWLSWLRVRLQLRS